MDAIAQAAYEGDAETLAQLVEGVRLPNDFALGVAASAGHVECVVQYMDVLNPRKQTGLIRAFPFVLKQCKKSAFFCVTVFQHRDDLA